MLCPALDRVCRSVADFLALFEFLNQHGVEFISLRENFDTTTPQGQFVATVLMAMADKLLAEWVSMDQQGGQSFVKENLNELGQRQMDLQHGLAEVQQEMDLMERESVNTDLVRTALGQVKELFGALKPYEQRELMQLVPQRAEVNEREITL